MTANIQKLNTVALVCSPWVVYKICSDLSKARFFLIHSMSVQSLVKLLFINTMSLLFRTDANRPPYICEWGQVNLSDWHTLQPFSMLMGCIYRKRAYCVVKFLTGRRIFSSNIVFRAYKPRWPRSMSLHDLPVLIVPLKNASTFQ